MESVVNQCANGAVVVLLETIMMVLCNSQKAYCYQYDDDFAYLQ